MPEWGVPLATALLGALTAIVVAAINKRRARADPAERLNTFIGQIQTDRAAGREQLATMTNIATQFMAESVTERNHSTAVEQWAHAVEAWISDGMPDPPGQPLRPTR